MSNLARHIYVHVPFCARRCSYCDFSIAVRREVPVREFIQGLHAELGTRFTEREGWTADTLYFGGGTPSRLGGDGIAEAIATMREFVRLTDDAELTIEANPDDISDEAVHAWRNAGVNRLSLGAQSFDDKVLSWMHRTHDAKAIEDAVRVARAAGIKNVSVDLIFSLPEFLDRDWEADLDRTLALEPSHVSLYGLTIEPKTPAGRWRDSGQLIEAPEERYEREFLTAHRAMTSAGFDHYEVSNFALQAKRSRHNASYWTGAPYVGLGPSAHEFNGTSRRWNASAYVEWLERVGSGRDPIEGSEELSADNRVAEEVYLGLRTSVGLLITPAEIRHVERWNSAGWAILEQGGRVRLTADGWLRLDALAADLTLFRSRY